MWSIIHSAVSAMRAGELAKLDPVELIHVHHRLPSGLEHRLLRRVGGVPNLPDDFDFEQPQFPVGDDEEVAAAARRIEERQAAELRLEDAGAPRGVPGPGGPSRARNSARRSSMNSGSITLRMFFSVV